MAMMPWEMELSACRARGTRPMKTVIKAAQREESVDRFRIVTAEM